MSSLYSIRTWSAILFVGAVSASQAQSVTTAINLPAQRESTLELGRSFLASREKEKIEYENAPDPFIGKVAPVVAEVAVEAAPVPEKVINEVELLRNLASQISARGTAILGEDRFLLLSQKRLKVGESFIISFNGNDYEVVLSDLTSTTFTIKRNDLTFTRPVLLSR
jgi:hypothetical protein